MKIASMSGIACISMLTLVFTAGTSKIFATTPKPIQWSLSASSRGSALKKGAQVAAHLHATIQPGWHLYALDQEPGGPTATRITLSGRQPFVLDGDIEQPTPTTAIDPNFNLETHYYEDQATFTIPLKATAAVKSGSSKVSMDVLYQTCNDTMCLPPTVSHLTSAVKP